MLILEILGVLLALFTLFVIGELINRFTTNRYNYLFFNKETFISSLVGYAGCFIGDMWYMSALKEGGDVLNGLIIIGVGVIALLWTLYSNIKNTNFIIGIVFTPLQQLGYLVVAAGGAIFMAFIGVLVSQAKPVYRID